MKLVQHKLCSVLAMALIAGGCHAIAPEIEPQQQPNIVLFLVDDMGWQDTSLAFANEKTPLNRHFKTPNMELLAKQGVRFNQAYSHAVCSPSRVSMMTGQNPTRHHVSNWTRLAGEDHSGKWGPNAAPTNWRTEGLQPSDVTLPKLLQQAGYFTIHVGKAHFGALGTKGAIPTNLGFDVNVAGHAAGAPASYWGEKNFGNDMPVIEGYPQGVPGLSQYHQKAVHLTDVLTERAKHEMTKASQSGKPFFLNMAHYAVHTPIEAHQRFIAQYQNKTYDGTDIDIPDVEEKYASMVQGMDASLGELIAHLKTLGIAENTLIIFTSDNGGLSGHTRQTTPRGTELNSHNWPLKSGKGSAYEGGTRVPYIASWAQNSSMNQQQSQWGIIPNSVSNQQIIIEDLFPTILALANGTTNIPKDYKLDGIDVTKHWLNPGEEQKRAMVFHYPHVWGPFGPGYEPHSAMRLGEWKVIYYYNSRRWQLYNIEHDLAESYDLARLQPNKLQFLSKELKRQLIKMDVQWPVNRVTGKLEKLRLPIM